jgi:hypothetical protein
VILLWGPSDDAPLAAVRTALAALGGETVLLDHSNGSQIGFRPLGCEQPGGRLILDNREVDLACVSAAYIRPVDGPESPACGGLSDGVLRGRACYQALLSWCDVASARIVNRPEAMASNNSKPYQAALIHAAGFKIPETIITNDAHALAVFAAHHGTLIYKSASGIRSIVAVYDPADLSREADLATCPTQFQRRIMGTDVRVHVVGSRLFACQVRSSAVDYRYPAGDAEWPELAPCSLPSVIAARCRELAATLRLDLAGIDLRVTEGGEWFCFEVNPSPGFVYYEKATGLPIAAAVAELLLHTASL